MTFTALVVILLLFLTSHASALTLTPAYLAITEQLPRDKSFPLTVLKLRSSEPWVSDVFFVETGPETGKVLSFEPNTAVLYPGEEVETQVTLALPGGMPSGKWRAKFIALSQSREIPTNLALQGVVEFETLTPQGISRVEAVAMLSQALGLSTAGKGDAFKDLRGYGEKGRLVAAAAREGLIKGYPDGSFQPAKLLTRAEAAVLIARIEEVSGSDYHQPVDIAAGHWALKHISATLAEGFFNTSPEGSFFPDQPVSAELWEDMFLNPADRDGSQSKSSGNNSKESKNDKQSRDIKINLPLKLKFKLKG